MYMHSSRSTFSLIADRYLANPGHQPYSKLISSALIDTNLVFAFCTHAVMRQPGLTPMSAQLYIQPHHPGVYRCRDKATACPDQYANGCVIPGDSNQISFRLAGTNPQ